MECLGDVWIDDECRYRCWSLFFGLSQVGTNAWVINTSIAYAYP